MLSDRDYDHDQHTVRPVGYRTGASVRFAGHPAEQIIRTSLVGRLRAAHRAPFVLISAPAGYGKSTVLAQWCASRRQVQQPGRPFAVVTLDSENNDPVSFWCTVVHALERACPDIGVAHLIQQIKASRPDLGSVVIPLVLNEIETHCPSLVLALDNYQTITAPECHEQVAYLLHHLPAQSCLVLATRTDPPLPLARMRAGGDIVELRMADLRFARHEAAEVVRTVSGQALGDAALDRLMQRTEGWPAMVRLAARLLRDQPAAGAFLDQFSGATGYVMDYLDEEVLRQLPGDVQRFLARTSILHRFNAPLCDAVTGTTSSADLLDGLERSNLLLVPLDGVRTWYRYHHLFAEALRTRLARSEPGAATTMHRRAATWYERHAMVGDAIVHALGAGDTHRGVQLIARHWARQVFRGELSTVHRWVDDLGADPAAQSACTAVCAAWVLALRGERMEGQRWLKTAERLGHPTAMPDGMQGLRGAVALHHAAFGFGGITEMLSAARIATDLHAEPGSPWYAQARVALGYGRYLAGEHGAAITPLEQAADAAATLPVLRIQALAVLSLVTGELGRAAQSADLARAARDEAVSHRLTESTQVSLAQIAEAAVLVREGHLLRARQVLSHTLRARRAVLGLTPWPTLTALLMLARTVLALGDRDEARALLDEAADVVALLPAGPDHVTAGLAELERRLAGGEPGGQVVPPPLTDREDAVLRLLQGSLPLREIAAQLFVTVNTVKSHTRLIYRKLGVGSRAEAVRRARELGLL